MFLDMLERAGTHASVEWHNMDPLDPSWYTEAIGGASSFAGFPINPDTSLRVSTVFACNSLIAECIASMPCDLMRRTDDKGGKEKAKDHRWYRTIRRNPFQGMTSMDWYGDGQMNLGLRGNAMFHIEDDGVRHTSLRPLQPAFTNVEHLATGRKRFNYWNPDTGKDVTYQQDEVLHVRDLSLNGFSGNARATLAREAIAVAAAGEAFVGGFFKNDEPPPATSRPPETWTSRRVEGLGIFIRSRLPARPSRALA